MCGCTYAAGMTDMFFCFCMPVLCCLVCFEEGFFLCLHGLFLLVLLVCVCFVACFHMMCSPVLARGGCFALCSNLPKLSSHSPAVARGGWEVSLGPFCSPVFKLAFLSPGQ